MGGKRNAQAKAAGGSSGGGVNSTYLIVGLVAALLVGGFGALVFFDARQQAGSAAPGDVRTFDVGPGGQHSEVGENVDYDRSPPTGGVHDPIWQNSGFYAAPIRDENAVHTLEHGAVWIAYSPDLPQGQVQNIQTAVEGQTCMLASPYEGLSSPIVASAWGKQLSLESADDPELERFIRAFRQGPQTPEPGASCTGGTSETV